MIHVEIELERLAEELRRPQPDTRWGQLYAAQQALSWALNQECFAGPIQVIENGLVHPIWDMPGLDAFYSEPIGSFSAFRAVARLAIETWIAEAVQASGVDVEALVAALPRCNRGSHDSPGSIGCPECGYENSIADALRTAIAQAVAREGK